MIGKLVQAGIRRSSSIGNFARLLVNPRCAGAAHLCDLLMATCNSGIPTIQTRDLVEFISPRDTDPPMVKLHGALTGVGSGSIAEMAVLSLLVAVTRPRAILEFGTCDGCSTWHLWANAPPTATILTIDLPAHTKVSGSSDEGLQGMAHRPFLPIDPRVRVLEVDSRLWTPELDSTIDFCFIDAGHTYECVRNDTEKALHVLSPRGLIVWHDAAWRRNSYGVNAYLRELRRAGQDIKMINAGPYDYCALAVLQMPP